MIFDSDRKLSQAEFALLCMGNQTYGNNDLQYWNMQKVGIKSENIFGCKYFIAVSFTSVTIILVARTKR